MKKIFLSLIAIIALLGGGISSAIEVPLAPTEGTTIIIKPPVKAVISDFRIAETSIVVSLALLDEDGTIVRSDTINIIGDDFLAIVGVPVSEGECGKNILDIFVGRLIVKIKAQYGL